MLLTFKRLVADQSGATAIEYGLICALISMFLIIAFNVGDSLIASLQLWRLPCVDGALHLRSASRSPRPEGPRAAVSYAATAATGFTL